MKERLNMPYIKLFVNSSFTNLVSDMRRWVLEDCAEKVRRSPKQISFAASSTSSGLGSFSCLVHYELGTPQKRDLSLLTVDAAGSSHVVDQIFERTIHAGMQKLLISHASLTYGTGHSTIFAIIYSESVK